METQLTKPPRDYINELRVYHKSAESAFGLYFENAVNAGRLLEYAKSNIHRGFRQYCIDAGIPKTTAYRYISIFHHAPAIEEKMKSGMGLIQSLKSAIRDTTKIDDPPIEIDITPKVVVLDEPMQNNETDNNPNLFNGEEYPNNSYKPPKPPNPKQSKNNHRARMATAHKTKSISRDDLEERLSDLAKMESESNRIIENNNANNLYHDSRLKKINDERERLLGYRIK